MRKQTRQTMMGNLWRPQLLAAALACAAIAGGAAAQAGNNAAEFTTVPAAADAPPPRAGMLPQIVPPVRLGIGLSGSSAVPFRVHPPGMSRVGPMPTALPLAPRPLPTSAGGGD